MQTETDVSAELIQYIASMVLGPLVGAAVLGLFWVVRTLKETVWP
jgi:hypothetical protein